MSLQRSADAFKSSMSSAANLFPSRPKPVNNPPPPPPPTSTNNGTSKRKRIVTPATAPAAQVYTQPSQITMEGQHLMTQVLQAQSYLKEKEQPLPIAEVARHLGLSLNSEVFTVFKENKNPRVWYSAENDTLEFRPLHNIRSKTDLLAFLQRQSSAQGLPVKELKEGWAGAIDAIDTLEAAGEILVVRTKKENQPRMVWGNDKTLLCEVDDDFRDLWHGIKIPPAVELVGELEGMGLKPASVDPSTLKVEVKKTAKRKRAVNRKGKVSNVHMSGILKDSKDLKK
jgi:transcription initiation factor TFIIE subunit beta